MRSLSKAMGFAVALFATNARAQSSSSPQAATADPVVAHPAACSDVEPQDVLDAARRHFGAGRTLVDAGALREAESELRAALRLYDSPNSHYLLGRSLRGQQRAAEAYNEFDLTIGLAARCSQADAARGVSNRYQQTVTLALRERDELTMQVAIVGVRLAGNPAAQVNVSINDSRLASDGLGRAFAYSPGEITIDAQAEGFLAFHEARQCSAGQTIWVDVRLAPVAGTSMPPTTRSQTRAPSLMLPVGIGVGAAGVIAAAAGGTLFFLGRGQFEHLHAMCTPSCPDDPGFVSQVNAGQSMETAGIATFWVGLGVAAVGAVIIAVSGRGSGRTGHSVSIWPGVDPMHRALGLNATF
ncbi:MAG: hypothetical protein WCJ30_02660 [Deltaproteobacteria bacterium]